jgi:N-acetylmuramoyl-L-alanine amidase
LIELLFILAFALQDLDQHTSRAWQARSVLLMGIAPDIKPLPWSLVNGVDPQIDPVRRMLPLEYYESADRERNRRLYGRDTVKLFPTMIVLHFTVVDDAESIISAFSRPSTVAVGNQRPVTTLISVHYMVDKDGTVYQLAEEDRTTSGTYGVDYCALAIEMVAKDELDLMSRPLQLLAAFTLTDRLLKKYDLPVWRVFSHQEVALGEVFLSEYTDLADTVSPYFYPEPHFRYDPGSTVMAWCREFLLRRRGLWKKHPAAKD